MGLRQVPARSPKAGALLRRIEARSRASRLGVAPHARTLRVRECHTITSTTLIMKGLAKGITSISLNSKNPVVKMTYFIDI